MGMTAYGPIPWTAINDYAIRYSYYGPDFERLEHYVGVLDGVYLSHKPTGKDRS